MTKDYDAVIVGARCAGAATALLLARRGMRVLVIDKGAYGSDTLSTHALMRGAVLQLHRWGVLPAIIAADTPAVRSTTFSYSASSVTIAIEPRDGVDALYAPRRALLDRTLVDAARQSGAQFEFGVRLRDLARSPGGRVAGVSVEDQDGRQRRIDTDIIIGADGIHSTVANLVGAPMLRTGRFAAGVLYSYWKNLPSIGYEWHYRPGVSVGLIPTNGDAKCAFIALPAKRFAAVVKGDAAAAYHRVLATASVEVADLVANAERVEPVRGFGGSVGFIRRSSGPGWALVGDAAYFKDPITAHGITDALRDAELVARATIAGTSTAFREYEDTRLELAERLFEITDEIASFTWTDEQAQGLHRALSREMAREVRAIATWEPLSWLSPLATAPFAV